MDGPRRTIYIGDGHGVDGPFLDSIHQAGVIRSIRSWEVTEEARERMIELVLLGDDFDRGHRNSHMMDGILELRSQLQDRLVHLAGNHEAMMLDSAHHPDSGRALRWVHRKGGIETLQRFCRTDIREALGDLGEYLLGGPGAPIVDNLQLMHRRHDVLAVHAGVDDVAAEIIQKKGIEEMNRIFSEHREERKLEAFTSSSGTYGGTLWGEPHLSETAASALLSRGIRWMINGHKSNAGSQVLWHAHGISVIRNDTSMWRGNPSYTELMQNGQLTTWNPKEGRIIVRIGT